MNLSDWGLCCVLLEAESKSGMIKTKVEKAKGETRKIKRWDGTS